MSSSAYLSLRMQERCAIPVNLASEALPEEAFENAKESNDTEGTHGSVSNADA